MPSETCQFCGIEIKFRHIGGTVVPLHPVGSECVGKRLYRDDERNICHTTRCPKCESKVFFIRHNGGCAWFDDLGRPWDKHACFADTSRIPAGWESRLKRGWRLCHLWLVGVLADGNRGIFYICNEKPDRRQSTYPLTQMKLQRTRCRCASVEALDGKTAFVNRNGTKIMTPRSRHHWSVSRHTPTYLKRWHEIDHEPLRSVV